MKLEHWKVAVAAVLVVGMGWVAACGSDPSTVSVVRGAIAQETFSAPVAAVVASANDGSTARIGVAPDGAFELQLDKGKKYQLSLELADGTVPLVISGAHGTYSNLLKVASGGAEANIGLVRFFDGTKQLRANVVPSSDACVDGYFDGTNEPCMSGEASVICTDEDDGDSDSESDSEGDGEGDHQCEDGIGPDGADCDGGPAANGDAGEQGEMVVGDQAVGVPEYSLPESLDCGNGEEEGDDDDDDDD